MKIIKLPKWVVSGISVSILVGVLLYGAWAWGRSPKVVTETENTMTEENVEDKQGDNITPKVLDALEMKLRTDSELKNLLKGEKGECECRRADIVDALSWVVATDGAIGDSDVRIIRKGLKGDKGDKGEKGDPGNSIVSECWLDSPTRMSEFQANYRMKNLLKAEWKRYCLWDNGEMEFYPTDKTEYNIVADETYEICEESGHGKIIHILTR